MKLFDAKFGRQLDYSYGLYGCGLYSYGLYSYVLGVKLFDAKFGRQLELALKKTTSLRAEMELGQKP